MKSKRIFSCLLICALILLMPFGALANSATFFDVDNEVTYSIALHSKTAEIGGDISYTVTIYNRSDYSIISFRGRDSLGNEFAFIDDNGIEFQPGQKFSFDINGTVPEDCDWYFKNGKAYVNIEISYSFDTHRETMEPTTTAHAIKDYPKAVELTNLRDGRKLIELSIPGDSKEMYFMDDGYNLKYKLNSSKINVWGYTILPITINNISQETFEDVTVLSTVIGGENYKVSLQPGESAFGVVYADVQIKSGKLRPRNSDASARIIFMKDGKYVGVRAVTTCRNVFIDQAPELAINAVVLSEYQESTKAGKKNYKVTITNISKNTLQNFYVIFLKGYPEEMKQNKNKVYQVYQLKVNETIDFHVEMKENDTIVFEAGGMFFGEPEASGTYEYNLETGELSVTAGYPGLFYEDFDEAEAARYVVETIGGDLPEQLGVYLGESHEEDATSSDSDSTNSGAVEETRLEAKPKEKEEVEAEAEEEKTKEPVPTPTTKIIYIEKKPAIPSWVWPVLGVVIVLAGGLVLWMRQKQSEKDK